MATRTVLRMKVGATSAVLYLEEKHSIVVDRRHLWEKLRRYGFEPKAPPNRIRLRISFEELDEFAEAYVPDLRRRKKPRKKPKPEEHQQIAISANSRTGATRRPPSEETKRSRIEGGRKLMLEHREEVLRIARESGRTDYRDISLELRNRTSELLDAAEQMD